MHVRDLAQYLAELAEDAARPVTSALKPCSASLFVRILETSAMYLSRSA